MSEAHVSDPWTLVCHMAVEGQGRVAIVRHRDGTTRVETVPPAPDTGAEHAPVFLGTAGSGAILMDPLSKAIRVSDTLPGDAVPAYAYRDPAGDCLWFMNDGDEETGCDELNCGTRGSSVTVVRNTGDDGQPAEFLATLCVGRGHHVTTFTGPSPQAPEVPVNAYVSNLLDGTLSVIGNDPEDRDTYLKVFETINLHDPKRDKDATAEEPNNAFPHGKVFSPYYGMLYSLNNGYGTVNVIEPVSNKIIETLPLPVSSNLLLSPDGRFLIGKGADRKSDPEHVLGRLTVLDAGSGQTMGTLDLPDFYPSTYRFNADGTKLYVTSAATGKGRQREQLKTHVVMVFDTSALPNLTLMKEVTVGRADCGRRPLAFLTDPAEAPLVFIPNPTDATLSLLDGRMDSVIETVTLGDRPVSEVNFSFWDGAVRGA